MLRQTFDPMTPKRVVIYARMSSDRQNPRSPDQQVAMIQALIERLRLPWTIVRVYRDEGISGRYEKKRAQLQAMILDLKSRFIQADLVVVDTYERLTRAENTSLREKLRSLGVLVVTADSGFTDPTSVAGKALALVEAVRSTEDGRVKAHNVLRGKRDAIQQGRWAGGAAPLGYRLKSVIEHQGTREITYKVLEPDPETVWIVRRMFQLAHELGYGTTRIAAELNADDKIPCSLKPIHAGSVGEVLDREIYYGELVWGKCCTGIVNDVRKHQPLPEDQWLRAAGFCEPLVTREIWDSVHAQRVRRAQYIKRARTPRSDSPLMAAGISVKYLLAGMVVCGSCGRAMAPISSPTYQAKGGDLRRYVKYACPLCASGACGNNVRVLEKWLRETVVEMIRQRLFHRTDEAATSATFTELVGLVQAELAKIEAGRPDHAGALAAERAQLEERQLGWMQSLGSQRLSTEARIVLESQLTGALARIAEITSELNSHEHTTRLVAENVTPDRVAAALARLEAILASRNVAAANVLLAQHIEGIYCHADSICIRTCKLGPLAEIIDLIAPRNAGVASERMSTGNVPTTGRRRARRDLGDGFEDEDQGEAANAFAVDPRRFAGLGPEWFTDTVFPIPVKQPWTQEHAEEVFRRRQQTRCSLGKLALEFGVSRPTIRAAIQAYLAAHPDEADVRLRPGGKRPKHDLTAFASEARRLYELGAAKQNLAKQFGVSEPTLVRALKLAYAPDGGRIPTRREIQEPLIRRARELFDAHVFVGDIADAIGLSRRTTILLLEASLAREGKTLPNLRQRRAGCRREDANRRDRTILSAPATD